MWLDIACGSLIPYLHSPSPCKDECVLLLQVIHNLIRLYTNMITVQFNSIKGNLGADAAGHSRPLPLPWPLSLIGGVICSM